MARQDSRPVDNGSLVVSASALLVVIGAFLGWISIPIGDTLDSVTGIALFQTGSPVFNGLVTGMLATVVTVLSLFLPEREGTNVATAVSGLAIEVIAVAFLVAPDVALGPAIVDASDVSLASVGPGLFVTLLGGLGILLGGVASYRR